VLWIAALVCMVAGLSFAAPARAQSLNMGAGLRWHGWVQTDVKFSEFFGSNFTVMARFMPQYTRSYRGPILGVGRTCVVLPCKPGPRFALGQSDFKKAGDVPRLVLEIGNVTRTYLAPGLVPGTWQHIALRREKARAGAVFRLFLNGTQLCADPGAYSTCNLTLAAPALPVGTLRLGRTWSSNGGIAATRQQFYGLLDDVAVFDSALPPGQIAALANATLHPRLLGWEPGLYAGWTFDAQTPTGDPLPASLARPITYEGGAYLWPFLSQTRDSEFDDDYLPVAREDLVMDLPFPQGQAWKVTQGYSSTASHYGASAFSIDAVANGGKTVGKPVYASTSGKVVFADDTWGDLSKLCKKGSSTSNCNLLQVLRKTGVVLSYRHLHKGSIHAALGAHPLGATVTGRQKVGTVGDHPNGGHLHFGVTTNWKGQVADTGLTVSYPVVYREYEVFNPLTSAWELVHFGVPGTGQIVRVP
jgi:murein DD-endopeptidase MepM/ murein hydrolase activator NlpD